MITFVLLMLMAQQLVVWIALESLGREVIEHEERLNSLLADTSDMPDGTPPTDYGA